MAKNKKTTIWILVLISILFVALTIGGILYYNRIQTKRNNDPNQKNPITETDTVSGNLQADPSSTSQRSTQKLPGSVTITTLAQDQDGVVVGTVANGVSKGTCTVVFEKGGTPTVTETAPLGPQVSYYTCKGFNPISIAKFSQKGDWTAYVKITDGDADVRSDIKTINIQ